MKILTVLLTLLMAGCAAPRVEHVSVPLPMPVRPELPGIKGADLQCLSDDAYRTLVRRDRMRREYAEQLEAVILSTHDND